MLDGPAISADEFMEIQTPDTVRLELDEGSLVVSPHNIIPHQYTARALASVLHDWAQDHRSGQVLHEVDVKLADRTVRIPDIVFVANEQKRIVKRRRVVGAPRLVVEVLSESTEAVDRGVKARQYAAAGVAHYWLVDPMAHTIELFTNRGGVFEAVGAHRGAEVFSPAGFEGLGISCGSLWLAELPPDE